MKKAPRNVVKALTRNVTPMTGRDGGVDYAARMEMLNPSPVGYIDGHVYRVIEIVGTSEKSIEEAVTSAIERAHQTIRHLRWFEVVRTSGHIDEGKVSHFQVTLKVGFTMESAHKSASKSAPKPHSV